MQELLLENLKTATKTWKQSLYSYKQLENLTPQYSTFRPACFGFGSPNFAFVHLLWRLKLDNASIVI